MIPGPVLLGEASLSLQILFPSADMQTEETRIGRQCRILPRTPSRQ